MPPKVFAEDQKSVSELYKQDYPHSSLHMPIPERKIGASYMTTAVRVAHIPGVVYFSQYLKSRCNVPSDASRTMVDHTVYSLLLMPQHERVLKCQLD